jgi:hypothetical protein
LWEEQREPNFASTREVGHARVGRLLSIGGRHSRQQSYHHEQNGKTLFHGVPLFSTFVK